MIKTFVNGFNVAVKHGCIGLQTVTVRGFGDFKPSLARQFSFTGDFADSGAENLGPAAGDGTESGCLEFLKSFAHVFPRQFGKVKNLNTGKGLNMDIRPDLFDTSKQSQVVGIGKVGMDTTHHVDLVNRLIKTLTHLFFDFVHTHFIGKFGSLVLTKGAEFAQIGADVGIIDVLIVNKIGLAAVFTFSDDIGQVPDSENVGRFKKSFTVIQAQAFIGAYFAQNITKAGIGNKVFHKKIKVR